MPARYNGRNPLQPKANGYQCKTDEMYSKYMPVTPFTTRRLSAAGKYTLLVFAKRLSVYDSYPISRPAVLYSVSHRNSFVKKFHEYIQAKFAFTRCFLNLYSCIDIFFKLFPDGFTDAQ